MLPPIYYTGAGIYVTSGTGIYATSEYHKILPNNSLITTQGQNRVHRFQCLSGSARANVGRLISPLGDDITFSRSDPFSVRQGGSQDPGTLRVRIVRQPRREETGIYTYRTPDENGNIVEFYFGIYQTIQSGIVSAVVSNSYSIPTVLASIFIP